ncbi:unnamed protein product [Clonostachys rosea]|uniref:Uncharacterized protein n=1 Tax=Bionectria ochroleuca TaxID=29856 RepID=A0ABY6U0X5_BIOOC|nr:unnamed protein product [Clonostachys rosea]
MSNLFQRAPEGCRSDSIPSGGIDHVLNPDLKFGYVPWTNNTEGAAKTCCEDSPIIVYDDCWLICELPDSIQKKIKEEDISTASAFSSCIRLNWPKNASMSALAVGGSSPAMHSAMVPNFGQLVLLVFGLLFFTR